MVAQLLLPSQGGMVGGGVHAGATGTSEVGADKNTADRAALGLGKFVSGLFKKKILFEKEITGVFERALLNSYAKSGFLFFPLYIDYLINKKDREDDYYNSREDTTISSGSEDRNIIKSDYSALGYHSDDIKSHDNISAIKKNNSVINSGSYSGPLTNGQDQSSDRSQMTGIDQSIEINRIQPGLDVLLLGGIAKATSWSALPDPENGGGNKKPGKGKKLDNIVSKASNWITIIQFLGGSLEQLFGDKNTGCCQPCCPAPPPQCDTLLNKEGKYHSVPERGDLNNTLDEIRNGVNGLLEQFVHNAQDPIADKAGNDYNLLRGRLDDIANYMRGLAYKSSNITADHSNTDHTLGNTPEVKVITSSLGDILTEIRQLTKRFVSDMSEQSAGSKVSPIESQINTANTTLSCIQDDVNRLAEHVISEAYDKADNRNSFKNTQELNWSLMLLGNIAIDMKRMADRYVGNNISQSNDAPVLQNILDISWLNSSLTGIQDSTSRTAAQLPIQSINHISQTNNFSISGAQEPRVVADAVSERVLNDYSQVNQIFGARMV